MLNSITNISPKITPTNEAPTEEFKDLPVSKQDFNPYKAPDTVIEKKRDNG